MLSQPGADPRLALGPFLQLAQGGDPGFDLGGLALGGTQGLLGRRPCGIGDAPRVVGHLLRFAAGMLDFFRHRNRLAHRGQIGLGRRLHLGDLGLQPLVPALGVSQGLFGGALPGGRQLDGLAGLQRRCPGLVLAGSGIAAGRFERRGQVGQREHALGEFIGPALRLFAEGSRGLDVVSGLFPVFARPALLLGQ